MEGKDPPFTPAELPFWDGSKAAIDDTGKCHLGKCGMAPHPQGLLRSKFVFTIKRDESGVFACGTLKLRGVYDAKSFRTMLSM